MSSNKNEQFSIYRDYLAINPEKASLFDLICLLFCNELLDNNEFLEKPSRSAASDEQLKQLSYRWMVVISILAQKILLLIKNPLAWFGHLLELWLNLLSNNGGLLKLSQNLIIAGRVSWPVESSETYRSWLGHVDVRVDLDDTIHPQRQHERYAVHLSFMASKLAYENPAFVENVVTNHWQMKMLHFYNFWNAFQQKYSTQAFVCQSSVSDPDLVVISFRGTETFNSDDWCSDVDISWFGIKGVGKLHCGFMKALGLPKTMDWPKEINSAQLDGPSAYHTIRQLMREICNESKKAKFIVTGHSLGAALAILFTGMLAVHDEEELLHRVQGVYTFGQPRVGDAEFGEYMNEKLKTYNVLYRRFVYCNDVVPRLPYDDKLMFFKHFGPCIYYDGLYKGKELPEEPNKNYFSLRWLIPMHMNACWELVRSIILPIERGSSYNESWSLRVLRVVGMFIPGFSAHSPQDYNNATRIGTTEATTIDHLRNLEKENVFKFD